MFSDHLVDDMGAIKIIFICAVLLISTDALYLSSTPVRLPDDYNGTSALPLSVPVEDNEAASKEDDFNDILKTNFYLKHLVKKPEIKEVKARGSIEISSSHDDKARIVVEDKSNTNKTIEIKEDIMDIIIFPDSDILIPPKERTTNKTTDNETVAENITSIIEAHKPENKADEAAKTNVSDPDLLNRFGLSDKEYLLVPIGTVSQNTLTAAAPTQPGYQILQQNLGVQQPVGLPYSNVHNVLSNPRSDQASAVHFPNQHQVLPQNNNLNFNPGYQSNNNANQNLLTPQQQVNNNMNQNYETSPGHGQQNLNTNYNNNYATNPGYLQIPNNLNNNYGPPSQSQGSVNFPNGQNSYVPGYALTNVNTNLNNNYAPSQPSFNNDLNNRILSSPQPVNTNLNGGVQYTNQNQGYQPPNQIYGNQNQSPITLLQNPGNQQLLFVSLSYPNGITSGYQSPAASQGVSPGNQLYLLSPAGNSVLLSVPGGSTVQGYMIVPRSSSNLGSS